MPFIIGARNCSRGSRVRNAAYGLFLFASWLVLVSPVRAQSGSTFIYPSNGQQNVSTSEPFQWTSTTGALAYFLYVGSSAGACDLVCTGEIQTTSYSVPPLPAGETLYATIYTKTSAGWTGSSITFTATAAPVATFTYPSNGQQNVNTAQPFQWTAVSGALAYFLYVGSNPGACDLVCTGEIQANWYSVPPLPTGKTLYATIYTKSAAGWTSSSITFTAAAVSAAVFTYPTYGQQNVNVLQPFQWTAVSGALAYFLYVGSSPGACNLVCTGEIQATSYSVPPLPTGETLYATIYTELSSGWVSSSITFVAAPVPAVFTYPTNNQQNVNVLQPFQWTAGSGALAYFLYVGSSPGACDVVCTGEIQTTSYSVPPLPTGKTLYATIYTKFSSGWVSSSISFVAAPVPAVFTYPTSGQSNVNPTKPFQWTSASGALAYFLYVGSSPGACDVVCTGEIQTTSYSVPSLPSGKTLYATIYTKFSSGWISSSITFVAAPLPALFIYPTNGQENVTTTGSFQWTAVSGALAYFLYVGSSPGACDLVCTGEIQATSYSVPSLPAAKTLYATIYTKTAAYGWMSDSISFSTYQSSSFIYPVNNQQNVTTSNLFQWTAVSDALAYTLWVGSAPGGSDLVNTGETLSTSFKVPTLPVGPTLYGQIFTKLAVGWTSQTIQFVVSSAPITMLYPIPGSVNVDTTLPFRWTAVNNAAAYSLTIGTTPGGNDVLNTGSISQTSYVVPLLTANQQLYATAGSNVGGVWSYTTVSFQPAARFLYPTIGSTNVNSTTPFQWSPGTTVNGVAPTYSLSVGTTRGGTDLFSTGPIVETSYAVPSSALPVGRVLYARLQISIEGGATTLFADTVFTVAGTSVTLAQITYPANGANNADVSNPFTWTATDLAQAYRLIISNGSTVSADSGAISVPEYFAESLPLGTYTGQLGTEIAGSWYWTSFSFTVVANGGSMSKEIAAGIWAVDFVRNMAPLNGYPFQWTLLWNHIASWHFGAFCTDYSAVLVQVLSQMNIASRFPSTEQPRQLNIYFMVDATDGHTLVQMWDEDINDWILLDATFDMAMQQSSNGQWATVQDMNTATVNQDWGAITYQYGSFGKSIAQAYYIDYPLLYLNIPPTPAQGTGTSPMPYLQSVSLPVNQTAAYTIQCSTPTTVLLNGTSQTVTCSAIDSLAPLFWATSVALPSGSTASVAAYELKRFVF